jgi:AbrB family looped-hinge helix DNA binding protein
MEGVTVAATDRRAGDGRQGALFPEGRRDSLTSMAKQTSVVRLSSRGQIVIPASLRRRLGLRTGQPLAVRASGREVVFVPAGEDSADIEVMLRRVRVWVTRTRRDLVEELHDRRRAERAGEGPLSRTGSPPPPPRS